MKIVVIRYLAEIACRSRTATNMALDLRSLAHQLQMIRERNSLAACTLSEAIPRGGQEWVRVLAIIEDGVYTCLQWVVEMVGPMDTGASHLR